MLITGVILDAIASRYFKFLIKYDRIGIELENNIEFEDDINNENTNNTNNENMPYETRIAMIENILRTELGIDQDRNIESDIETSNINQSTNKQYHILNVIKFNISANFILTKLYIFNGLLISYLFLYGYLFIEESKLVVYHSNYFVVTYFILQGVYPISSTLTLLYLNNLHLKYIN